MLGDYEISITIGFNDCEMSTEIFPVTQTWIFDPFHRRWWKLPESGVLACPNQNNNKADIFSRWSRLAQHLWKMVQRKGSPIELRSPFPIIYEKYTG